MIKWIALADQLPPDEEFVLLCGPSGYNSRPFFVAIGRRHESYRPSNGGPVRWLDIEDDMLSNQGWKPTHWSPLPNFPEST